MPSASYAPLAQLPPGIVATDVSEAALRVADANARRLGIYNVEFVLADAHGAPISGGVIDLNVKDLASDLGLTHEALYRTLARMTASGEIKRSGGKIKLSRPI